MKKNFDFSKLVWGGVLIESFIFIYSYLNQTEIGEAFRYSARYSGRFSLLVYLFCFYYFAANYPDTNRANLHKLVSVFCILHFIHFGFLATNVYLNQIQLIPYKLAGGFLAYLMILLYPFFINHPKLPWFAHLAYFYYVGIVMAITYISRINGSFEGASPDALHYFGLVSVIIAFVVFSIMIFRKNYRLNP